MSSGKRKLSFLGFAPQAEAGEDEVRLDDEMERVVWGAGGAPRLPPPPPPAQPLRDAAAPPPPYDEAQAGEERRVQFDGDSGAGAGAAGGAASPDDEDDADLERRDQRHARHLHALSSRKYSLQDAGVRRGAGATAGTGTGPGPGPGVGADEPLADEARAHRSEELRAHPRHRPQHRGAPEQQREPGDRRPEELAALEMAAPAPAPAPAPRGPHSVFVQLDELLAGTDGEAAWQETARWIKYEEDVEEGSERWGRPHVASLSFHSLLNLRRGLESGAVLLSLGERDLPGVAYRVAEALAESGLIADDDRPVLMRSLLLRHKHVHEDRGFRFSLSHHLPPHAARKHASYTSLQSLWMEEGGAAGARCSLCSAGTGAGAGAARAALGAGAARASLGAGAARASLGAGAATVAVCRRHSAHLLSFSEAKRRRSSVALGLAGAGGEARKKSSTAEMEAREVEYLAATAAQSSSEELRRSHHDSILRRIPGGAEATTVLVGAVGFLAQPAVAFVRLADAILMPGLTEVPVPVRFMFVLLGPAGADLDYHEVGRSISTLMANPAFLEVAYRADDRRELLSAINEFLDDSIVLPPGDWDRAELLPLAELRATGDMIRRRKRDALQRRRAAQPAPAHVAPPTPNDEKKALLAAEAEPPREPDDPLARTGRLFGGVVRDMRRRYPHYRSDFKDALSGQVAAATIFMYFAALSSAITFGGLLAEKTDGQIGISETLVFTCVGGVVFALTAGQPLMITGATGPLLLLDQSLFEFCRGYGLPFLVARMYCGLWMVAIALGVAALEGSAAVKKITRFTEDIFAFLISLIFISEPITNLIGVYRLHPLGAEYCSNAVMLGNGTDVIGNATGVIGNGTEVISNGFNVISNGTGVISNGTAIISNGTDVISNGTITAVMNATAAALNATLPTGAGGAGAEACPQPNTALWCTMLTLSTFAIAYYLRIFRNGKFLGRSVRRALGDFGVPIAIVTMVVLARGVPVWAETLRVPAGLRPTAARAWLVPADRAALAALPPWAAFAMAAPALMVYIIIFMETHIAELIVDKPERRLSKGSGFHMDVVVLALVNALGGMLGAPWQCVATVRSVSHVAALTTMSTTHAPGEKPYIVDVKEQRVSALLVSLLLGGSVLLAGWLRLVPMAVLFGVFLYMGVSALAGIQLWERAVLLLKPVKHHPQVPYVRRVPTLRMHLFTLVQLAALGVLFLVKSSRMSLALPFFLVLCVPLRQALGRVFTPLQLRALDGAQKEIDKDDEPDFYEEAPLPG